ncbi:winged helix-turn-helix transcriptional regulator [Thioclava sp. FR2]|uniref:winged helix-turn-helix transcriptional regulator n=1 Tax=Thioclava sp. FR2 TaxID=3445780 RepID=UPI003EBE5C64
MTKSKRSYDEGCIAAHALDLIGDRWALLIVRELMLGPRRFNALREGLPGISANVLTVRLGELEATGVILREELPAPVAITVYGLTAAGEALWPVIKALCIWGARQEGHDPTLFISPTALMLSMRAMCARDRAKDHVVNVLAADEPFSIRTKEGHYAVRRGMDGAAHLTFEGGTNALASAIYGRVPLAQTAQGLIGFEGDLGEGQDFVDLFSLRV